MDLTIAFVNWVKGLTDGEATLYSLLVSGFCVFLGWIIRWLRKPKTASKAQSDSIREDLPVPVDNKITVNEAKAETGGLVVVRNDGVINVANNTPLSVEEIEEQERHYLNLVMKECCRSGMVVAGSTAGRTDLCDRS